jgi:RHS repeat-associated protein
MANKNTCRINPITKYEDNKIMYEEVFPGINLRHVSFNNEVKEDWIIKSYQGINEFNYEVATRLTPRMEENGSIGFYKDKKFKNKVFELPSPIMEDSNYNSGLGNGVQSRDLHYELSKLGKNQYNIKLVVDKKWLESPDRVYPVYIDPSVTIDALGDTFVSSAYPNTNYNKEWDSSQGEYVLKVGKYDSTTGTNYAFIKFSIVGDLKGAIIDSATLKVYVTHAYYATTPTGLWVDRVNGPWNVDELTWNNKPSSTNITSTKVARDQWASFNVTSTIQSMVDGDIPNYGFKFHTNGNGQTYWKKITAAESPNKAKIIISYHYPTMKSPTVSATQYADGKTTGYVNVSWPSVYGAKSYELQMYDGKGFETVYNGTATSWTSKSKKIFPKAPYSTSSTYKLDGSGEELPTDPSKFYSAKSGTTTTRKEYGFRVIAHYESGDSPASSEVKKAIPANLVDTPNMPTVKAYAYPETDPTNKGRGWLDISWDPVEGATGYKVLIYNGIHYEEFNVGNTTSWSTKGQKVWPTDSEIAQGKYALHKDKTGAELPIDPNPVYVNASKDGGDYTYFHRYSIRIKAVCDLGTTPFSESQYGYIPLETPKNVNVSGEVTDYVNNKGALNITWSPVTGAGGYRVELYDGKNYKSFDVGKTTSWNTAGISLFDGITDLPVDPTKQYQEIGASQTLIDKKAYQVRVRAYRYTAETAPSSEAEKMTGDRGLSAPSATQLGNIPNQEDLLGLEDYFTYGTHQLGNNATASVNVTTGNMVLSFTDQSLYTRGTLGFDFTRYYNSRSTQSSAFGKGWTFAGNESLVKKEASSNLYYYDEDGTRHEFVYNSSDGSYRSPKGKYLSLTNETVNGTSGYRIKDKDGFSKLFEQDPGNANRFRLYAYKDMNNNEIRFKYTGNQLTEIAEVDAAGNTVRNSIKISYNTNGMINKVAFKDRWLEYQYNSNNQLIGTVTKATGTTRTLTNTFDYDDENDQLSEYTDAKGNVNTFSYEDNELTILTPQSPGAESVSTTYDYDYKNNLYQVSDTEGRTTSYKRDTANQTYAVTETTNDDGSTTKVKYDSNYNVIETTDSDGNTETRTYDNQGNVIQYVDKEGKVTTYQYDGQNHLIVQTDPSGTKTYNDYDSHGNLIRSRVGEEVTEYQYDAYGRQIKVTYPNHTFIQTVYTDNSIVETDEMGNTTSTSYNDYGQVISKTDGAGRTISYEYDPIFTDLITSVTDGKGNKTRYTYDDNGNMLSLTDALGRQKTYTYNGNNQVTSVEMPVSGQQKMKIQYEYDQNGNLKTTIKNSGIKESYTYNSDDQLVGMVVSQNNQNVLGLTNSYNEDGQLTSSVFKDLLKNSNIVEKQFAYTEDDQLSQYNQGNFQLNYTYNDDHLITGAILQYKEDQPWMVKNNFTYTEEGKPQSVITSVNDHNMVQYQFSYDLTNRRDTVDVNNGLFKQITTLNESNNIQSIQYFKGSSTTPTAQYSYQYDQSGNIIKETTPLGDTTYNYDQNNQLISEVLPNGTRNTYEYDAVGNRTKATVNGVTSTYTYNDANQIVTKNGVPYVYDLDGNLTQDENYKYVYNALGQQTKVTTLSGETVAQYEYDENGLRTKKVIGTKTYEYYYESGNLSMEIVRDKGDIIQYRYYQWDTSGKPLGFVLRVKDVSGNWIDTPYYYWTNQRGDVISIMDTTGNEVGSYQYDAYGNVLSENGTIAKDNPIRYAGYYFDSETKHYYLKARYYDPENGNFLALDPHPGDDDDPLSQNGYIYARNNPIMNFDSDGNNWRRIVYAIKYGIRYWLSTYVGWSNAGALIDKFYALGGATLAGGIAYKLKYKSLTKNVYTTIGRVLKYSTIKQAKKIALKVALKVGLKTFFPTSILSDLWSLGYGIYRGYVSYRG